MVCIRDSTAGSYAIRVTDARRAREADRVHLAVVCPGQDLDFPARALTGAATAHAAAGRNERSGNTSHTLPDPSIRPSKINPSETSWRLRSLPVKTGGAPSMSRLIY
jgi:hypothetical protein